MVVIMNVPMIYNYARVSSVKQVKGSSLESQTERKVLEQLSAETGLLISDQVFVDEGKSAYHGDHLSGEFAKVLNLIHTGKIIKGSVLAVFSLDRLSREAVNIAMEQFLSIVNRGVKVYTAIDNKLFTSDSPNLSADLIVSLITMERAHEESATKSKRITQSIESAITKWELTGEYTNKVGVAPFFIDHKTGKFNQHKEAALYIVNSILSGVSDWNILKGLQENYTPPRKAWTQSTINKIRKKCPRYLVGDKVFTLNGKDRCLEGLYPSLISLDQYNRLKALSVVTERRKTTNTDVFILSGLGECSICRSNCISFRKSPTLLSYVCSKAQKGEADHGKEIYNLPTIEALVCLLSQDFIRQRKTTSDNIEGTDNLARIEEDILKYRKAIKGLTEDLEEDYSPALSKALKSYESKLETSLKARDEALTGNVNTSSLESLEWLEMALRDSGNEYRGELKTLLKQVVKVIRVGRVEHHPESIINKNQHVGYDRFKITKVPYYTIKIEVEFVSGGSRVLKVGSVESDGKVSIVADDQKGTDKLTAQGFRNIKTVLTNLNLIKGLVVRKGNWGHLYM